MCHLYGIELFQAAVKLPVVPCDASPEDCGMCCECSRDPGSMLFEVENAHPGHPLMEMGNHPCVFTVVVRKAFYDLPGSISEECRFNVVPLPGNAVELVCLPETGKDFILLSEVWCEVNQHNPRVTLDIPPPGLHYQPLLGSNSLPGQEHGIIRGELRVRFVIPPYIWSDEYIIVAKFIGHIKCLGGNDRINTAHLIAYFPTCLKQKISFHFHIYS